MNQLMPIVVCSWNHFAPNE